LKRTSNCNSHLAQILILAYFSLKISGQNQSGKTIVGLKSFIITMACKDDKIIVDFAGTKTLQNESFFTSRERDLIQALKETVQSPPLRPFQKRNIK
jgi:hypothetical protein